MAGAIAHEWIEPHGGAEKVVDQLASLFPDAPIYALWDDAPDRYSGHTVIESALARSPLRGHKALALPAMPALWRRLPGPAPDWVVCSSHLFAHHASFPVDREVPKYVYAYTPARYIWNPELDRRGDNPVLRLISAGLKPLDRRRAHEAVSVAAISRFVADRIHTAWGVETEIIYPPVDVDLYLTASDEQLTDDERAVLDGLPTEFVLGASRFIPYKRLDLAIAVGEAVDLPVVLAGDGPERDRLVARAAASTVPVHLPGRPSTALLAALYRRAQAFVFPPVEDFGIMPVEAMASGTPVVCRSVGGSAETVIDGVTGGFFHDESPAELRRAFETAAAVDRGAGVARASVFHQNLFRARIAEWLPS